MITRQTLHLTDGTEFVIELSYGKLTDSVTIDTQLGTFTLKAPCVRALVHALTGLGMRFGEAKRG